MAGNFMNEGAPQHAQESLPALPSHLQSDTNLTAHLASRFHVHLPISRLSSQAVIAVNTFTSSSKGNNGTKEGSAMGAAETLASQAWTRLGARGENQAVVFLGESGSGKTTFRSHLLSSILAFSSTPLSTKLSYAAFVYDTLTTTKSVTTPTASKAGLFYELQYDTTSSQHPTLIGGKMLGHRLERSRIASVPTGERSFHALYYLLAGTSAAEKSHLALDSTTHHATDVRTPQQNSLGSTQKRWRYLGHPTQLKVGINDADGFQHFKTALRKLEFPRSEIAEICQILASILHLGQLEFATAQATTPAPDDSGGYSHEGGESVTAVRNKDVLGVIAAFLGVSAQDLEVCLGYKTKTLHRERVTVMLDPKGARDNADEFARTLYSLLVSYVIESINQRVCALEGSVSNTVSIVDFPGFAQNSATGCTLDQLLNNAATESLYHLCLQSFFERKADMLEQEEIDVTPTSYFDNTDAVKALLKPGNGVLSIMDDQMRRGKTDIQFLEALRKRFQDKNPAIEVGDSKTTVAGSNFVTYNQHATFTIRHFAGEVEYPVDGLLEENEEVVSGDVLNLIRSTRSDFVRSLFGQEALQTVYHPKEKNTFLQATLSSKPSRKPSMARRGTDRVGRSATRKKFNGDSDEESDAGMARNRSQSRKRKGDDGKQQGAAGEFLSALECISKSLSHPESNSYFVFCLKPNDRRIANQFDSKCVRNQLQTFGIAEISQRLRQADFSVFLPFGEFLGLADVEQLVIGSEREKAEHMLEEKRWPVNEAAVGSTGVMLSERCWSQIASVHQQDVPNRTFTMDGHLAEQQAGLLSNDRLGANDSRVNLLASPSPNFADDKNGGYFGSRDLDSKSEAGQSAVTHGDMFRNLETREQMAEKGNERQMEEVDNVIVSGKRKRWVFLVYLLTFYIPDFLIRWCSGIKRKDVRLAWREKLAINMLIWLSCGFVVFFIVIMPQLICPKQDVFALSELSAYNGKNGYDSYVAIRGTVFNLGRFMNAHQPYIIANSYLDNYAGKDATDLFPVQVSGMCQGRFGMTDPNESSISQWVQLPGAVNNFSNVDYTKTAIDINAQYHDFRAFTSDPRPTWLTQQLLYLEENYYVGRVGWPPDYLQKLASTEKANYGYIGNRVYDMTLYIRGQITVVGPEGDRDIVVPVSEQQFMNQEVITMFQQNPGRDLTKLWRSSSMDAATKERMKICLDNLFYVGDLDTRNSVQCLFARYILLAISILLASVIGFKFLAALQFGRKNMPENLDKFVICTIPAYTEDEESLRRAIDSAARMRYDDKRKLLVIICDGMIIGQGNDRPTPRIVLDVLGVPESVDPEPLSFESLGEGQRQHNMGKVYSGLYEVQGHIVPFLVVVKVGKPSELQKPGNRGKRDSQMILMRFLNRVHYNSPMTPLELEMHHQIRNIIGVNPTFYEFLLQIDADTVVAPDSATRMISAFLHDTRLIGVCGETALTNAKASFVTMMQVYEYYISHNLTKAFESLFGSVTCLPGCFSMYRIRAAETGKPLFVSREIIEDYSDIRVDTLHMKNLLHLGEDRYLTTLLMKYHSKYKTKYIFRAHAWTIAPDSWKVFLSQRRRWINSTVHNLIELIPLQQLCGFCCFSMRFIVFLDLLSTIVQPVIIGYIIYLIVLVVENSSVVPITAFMLLGAIYGLQAIIFIVRRKWEMIGWMIIYLLATPVFACGLPLYAFWHMDDFSWGNTRVVTGDNGRQIVVSDEGKFDPRTIPRKRWEEYQSELWDAQTQRDDDDAKSQISGYSYATKSAIGAGVPQQHLSHMKSDYNVAVTPLARSDYGFPQSRAMSPSQQLGYAEPPPRYPSQAPSLSMAPLIHTGGVSPQPGYEMDPMLSAAGAGGLAGAGVMPTDDMLLAEMRDILARADLMTVSKKSVKLELEKRFGLPPGGLDPKKMYISSATEAILSGQL